jgi:hypothetical protein
VRLSAGLLIVGAAAALVASAAAPDPQSLARRLGDPTFKSRDEAARELVRLGRDAAPALAAAAAADDLEVRARARALLAIVSGDETIRLRAADAAVRDALRLPDGLDAGSDADLRLAQAAPESGRALAAAARQIASHGFVPPRLAAALARHATVESLAALAEFVRDERLLPSTAIALSRVIDSSPEAPAAALAPLEEAMTSPAPATRRAAVALFGALAGESGRGRLIAACDDFDADVRVEAVRALGARAAAQSAHTLRALAADPNADVREAALTALAAVPGSPRPEPAVAAAQDASPAVRAAAARLLGRDATPETLGVLEALCSDPSARVRAAARRSLAALRG